ncbi:MAG TPA: protein translocase subunit SecF [Enteractinococcus helveticum]|uniref:Protein-export membrane protein SecF n=1 Tax=Enteractinococcus helveticum TaxID=1837282 RepID=A0A921FQJ6_9MICC|nr:protein translocase subunit SecF [Enteractinococcus helveticum]HJF15642.1 protein translocase subunit SecF [Enteractinococcus helveticum]
MSRLATWGNELYAGKKSYPFVQKWKTWFVVALILLIVAGGITALRGGFNLGIEFRGGSEFTVSAVENTDPSIGEEAVSEVLPDVEATATTIAPGTIRVQTAELSDDQTLQVATNLQEGYSVAPEQVTSNFVGPTWGEAVSQQMLIGLIVFLVLVALYLAIYFRTWKMSAAAIVGLMYVVALTVGIYGAVGFEVTPPAIIGFLLILSYSLYDTVVVFDKIRENTQNLDEDRRRTFNELVNLAVNQTLVRSITTSIVGILPVGSILFIGAGLLGAGTLRDISLSIFVGIIVGTVATLFIQAPLYALFRRNEAAIQDRDARVLDRRGAQEPQGEDVEAGTPSQK